MTRDAFKSAKHSENDNKKITIVQKKKKKEAAPISKTVMINLR